MVYKNDPQQPRPTQGGSTPTSAVFKRQVLTSDLPPEQSSTQKLGRNLDGCRIGFDPGFYTHLRAHETVLEFVCRHTLEKKKSILKISIAIITNHKKASHISYHEKLQLVEFQY